MRSGPPPHSWYGVFYLLLLRYVLCVYTQKRTGRKFLFWTWINPRFFGKPKSTKHWSSKAVFGERVWLNNKKMPVDAHHLRVILILNIITGIGLPFLVWGLYDLNLWAVILGLVLVVLGKMWFLDRMVWMSEDMKNKSEEYLSWEY